MADIAAALGRDAFDDPDAMQAVRRAARRAGGPGASSDVGVAARRWSARAAAFCCANVANLCWRAPPDGHGSLRCGRRWVRRRRILRQVLTESLVLAALGGVAGARIGAALLRVAPALVPRRLLPASSPWPSTVACWRSALWLRPSWPCSSAGAACQASGLTLSQVLAFDGRTGAGLGPSSAACSAWARWRPRWCCCAAPAAAAYALSCPAWMAASGHQRADDDDRRLAHRRVHGTPNSWYRFYDAIEREVQAVPCAARACGTLPLQRGMVLTGVRHRGATRRSRGPTATTPATT